MSRLKFNDGMEFETSGKLRSVKKSDGWYVVGQGKMIPCSSQKEARNLIKEMKGE